MKLSTQELLDKYSDNKEHAFEVQRLSLMIFDEVNKIFEPMSEKKRKILSDACLLHDIGYHISDKSHNKYSQKLILNYGLKDYNEREKEIISCICRYHRGSLPDKTKHEIYCNLDKKERKIVKRLGGILKIADQLDYKHMKLIKNLKINYDMQNNILEFVLTPSNFDFKPDIFPAIRKKDLFEIGFKTQVVFKMV